MIFFPFTPFLKKTVVALALAAFCSLTAAGCESQNDGYDINIEAIDRAFASFDKPDEPGCAAGLIGKGELVYAGAYGQADVQAKRAIMTETAFDIGSMSKQFTALSVLLLDDRGIISLDDSIRRHVPELGSYAEPVTLRHLMHHTGGLIEYTDLLPMLGIAYTDTSDAAATIDILEKVKEPNFPPGKYYEYNNTGYFLLGVVVSRATGGSFDAFVRKNIFEPLGMNHTGFVGAYPEQVQVAQGYIVQDGKFKAERSPWLQRGAGMIITTISDFSRWIDNFNTGKVGGRSIVSRMLEPARLENGQPISYGGGLNIVSYRGHKSYEHSGGWVGFLSNSFRLPDIDLSVVVLCNRMDAQPWKLSRSIVDVYLGEQVNDEQSPYDVRLLDVARADAKPREMPTGLYRADKTEDYLRLIRQGGETYIQVDDKRLPLSLIDNNVYKFTQYFGDEYGDNSFDTFLTLSGANGGEPARIFTSSLGNPGTPTEYVAVASWEPRDIERYVGHYSNSSFSLELDLEHENGQLVLVFNGERTRLVPAMEDAFTGKDTSLIFSSTEPWLLFNYRRVRNLRFVQQSETNTVNR